MPLKDKPAKFLVLSFEQIMESESEPKGQALIDLPAAPMSLQIHVDKCRLKTNIQIWCSCFYYKD
jgi:hypothetical protein